MITATRPWSDPATSTGHQRGEDQWRLDAACRGMDSFPFYPPDNARGRRLWSLEAEAKAICERCPVIQQCRDAGRSERFGVWGGLTAEERGWNGRGQRSERKQVAV